MYWSCYRPRDLIYRADIFSAFAENKDAMILKASHAFSIPAPPRNDALSRRTERRRAPHEARVDDYDGHCYKRVILRRRAAQDIASPPLMYEKLPVYRILRMDCQPVAPAPSVDAGRHAFKAGYWPSPLRHRLQQLLSHVRFRLEKYSHPGARAAALMMPL